MRAIRRLLAPALLLAAVCLAPVIAAAQTTLSVVEGSGRLVQLPREASSVFVADPNVADVQAVSGRSLYLAGISPGETNILALDLQDSLIVQYRVQVVADNAAAASILRDGAPSGGVGVRSANDVAVIYGRAGSIGEALAVEGARRALDGAGRTTVDRVELQGGVQVSLRVRFVEASRTALTELGFDLSAVGASGNAAIRLLTGSSGDLVGDGGVGLGVGGNVEGYNVDAVLNALERRGVVEILSEPTLTTTSGVAASFRAGGEFAYPVPQGDGVVTAAYRSYGVSIDFLPTVLPNGRIALEVSPEVSFINPDVGVDVVGFEAPSLSVRSVETTVEVGSGQTFAIAGLYEQFAIDGRESLPGLSGTPWGALFGGQSSRRDERELVIFITPFLAEASDAAAVNRQTPVNIADTVGFILK